MDYYSNIGPGYDELHGQEQDEKLREFLDHVQLRDNLAILDVGCGTGRSAAMLELYNAQWHGIDPSDLIEHAPKHARLRITKAPAERIPFPDASFDVILSLTALQNFDDAQQGLREIKRVAKPGALFMISFLKKSSKRGMLEKMMKQEFLIKEHWEQSKDLMYICEAR